MAGRAIGFGMYRFEAETDLVKVEAAAASFREFRNLLSAVIKARDAFGWESRECNLARIELQEWQRLQREADNLGGKAQAI